MTTLKDTWTRDKNGNYIDWLTFVDKKTGLFRPVLPGEKYHQLTLNERLKRCKEYLLQKLPKQNRRPAGKDRR